MTPEKRAEILRTALPPESFARYVARGLVQAKLPPRPDKGKAPPPPDWSIPKPPITKGTQTVWPIPVWVRLADRKPRVKVRTKRRKKVSALTKIAFILPQKLKRVPDFDPRLRNGHLA